MSTVLEQTDQTRQSEHRAPHFGHVLRAEWIKLSTVRSTWWTLGAIFVLGAGLTVLICALNAEWLGSVDADEATGSFITWGMTVAQLAAVVLGAIVVTSEYATGMVRTTFAAVPARGRVLAAKALLLAALLLVVGTGTALAGYFGGNVFLEREGVGLALEGDVLRSMYGSGLYLAGLGLLSAAVGFLVRHTAAAISLVLGVVLVLGNMATLLPDTWGEWVEKLMPGNAGSAIASPVPFNPNLLDAWAGLGVFAVEVGALLLLAWLLLRRRDA